MPTIGAEEAVALLMVRHSPPPPKISEAERVEGQGA